MSIDERLEYILTLQQSHDEHISKIIEQSALNSAAIALNTAAIALNTATIKTLTERTIQAMDAVSRLAHIADIHDQRIDDLEGQSPA